MTQPISLEASLAIVQRVRAVFERHAALLAVGLQEVDAPFTMWNESAWGHDDKPSPSESKLLAHRELRMAAAELKKAGRASSPLSFPSSSDTLSVIADKLGLSEASAWFEAEELRSLVGPKDGGGAGPRL